jgi:hypothetical protein
MKIIGQIYQPENTLSATETNYQFILVFFFILSIFFHYYSTKDSDAAAILNGDTKKSATFS